MNLRQAAEMALKALENMSPDTDTLVEVEPHVWEYRGSLVIQALRQALAQPEQEPVGYAHVEDLKREHHDFWVNREQGVNEVPLYTAPPQKLLDEVKRLRSASLTVQEIFACNVDGDGVHHICVEHQNLVPFVRAVEAKLKEKNT